MPKKAKRREDGRKRLVIDISLAGSAGNNPDPTSRSKICRNFLKLVFALQYRWVLTPELQREWNLSRNAFTRKWRQSMYQHGLRYSKVISQDAELRMDIENNSLDTPDLKAMLKDCHLLEAALATDKCIASLDDKVRIKFKRVAGSITSIRSIAWVNPEKLLERVEDWLRDGAENQKHRLLGK